MSALEISAMLTNALFLIAKMTGTVFIAALVGPPVGGFVLTVFASFTGPAGDISWTPIDVVLTRIFNGATLFVLLFSYVVGGIQATLCGLAFAGYGACFRRLPVWIAIVAPLLAMAAMPFVARLIMDAPPAVPLSSSAGSAGSFDGRLVALSIHVVPALVIWWLVRGYWKRADA